MTDLDFQIGHSKKEFQALQLAVFVAFVAVDQPSASWVLFLYVFQFVLSDGWFVG